MTKQALLLVDDEEDILEILEFELEMGGLDSSVIDIYTASNGLEGIEMIKNHNIDCVVSDINMPRMNGIDFVKAIQNDGFKAPVLFLSAHGDPDTIQRTENLNIYKFISKPFKSGEFAGIIKDALKNSETLKAS